MTMDDQAQTLLSINIPIYKRPELLGVCLSRTIEAVEQSGVWINVFDDSVDGTNDQVLRELGRRYPHIRHIRNAVNLGIDRNIDQAVRFGDAEYVWLLGEDDYLLPGALEKVLPALALRRYPVVAVNYNAVRNDLARISRISVMGQVNGGEMAADDLLGRLGWSMGFIGACVVRRAAILRVDSGRYLGTYFSHLGCIFEAAYGTTCMLVAEPLVANRAEDVFSTTWANQVVSVHRGLERLFLLLSPPYGRNTVELALDNAALLLAHRSVRGLASFRANGFLTLGTWSSVTCTSGARLRTVALMMTLMPAWAMKLVQNIVRNRRRRRMDSLAG